MITLTTEQAQQIEEALMKIADLRNLGKIQPEVIAFETLYIIRAAIAQPVLWQSKIVADCVSTVEMFNDEWRPLYAAPVRTKDLTEPLIDELRECRDLLMCVESCSRNNFENLAYERVQAIDAVIAADRELNK